MSRTRLSRHTSRFGEARERSATTYNGFTEGFQTPDLREAQSLLVLS